VPEKNQPETFRSHVPAIAGAVIGTLVSAVVGSHLFGVAGTRYALVIGSVVTGSASWWGERAIRKSNEIARAKMEARKAKGRPLTDTETQMIERVATSQPKWKGIHWRTILTVIGLAASICLLAIVLLDKVGARDVANVIHQPPQPTATVSIEPTVTPTTTVTEQPTFTSTPTSTPTLTPTASPTASPDASPPPSPVSIAPTTNATTQQATPTPGATLP